MRRLSPCARLHGPPGKIGRAAFFPASLPGLRRALPAALALAASLLGGPAAALSVDLIVPSQAYARTLGSGNVIPDFFGWIVVTDGSLDHSDVNAAVIDVTVSDPSFLGSGSLSVTNQIGTIVAGEAIGRSRTGSITDNSLFNPLLGPGESLILPAMDWRMNIDWPGSSVQQTETYTTTIEMAGLTATFDTAIVFDLVSSRFRVDAAQRIAMVPVPEPSSAIALGLGLVGLASVRRRD